MLRSDWCLEDLNQDECIDIILKSANWRLLSDLPMQYLIAKTSSPAKIGSFTPKTIEDYLVARYKCLCHRITRQRDVDGPIIDIKPFSNIESVEGRLKDKLFREEQARIEQDYQGTLKRWQADNDAKDRRKREAERLVAASAGRKIAQIRKNLRSETYTGLDDYINRVFVDRRDLINVCRTNTYQDFFGYHLNWDFCPMTRDYLDNVLREVQLWS